MLPEFTHSLHGNGKLPLGSNGLGINQLIYASIVLSRRGEANDNVHRFFLIEEPEAHLHPQLQDSFFHALNQITDHQLFVTSHSPTITAKTDLDKVIVMRRDEATGTAKPLHLAEAYRDRHDDKRYLHKFLDVTRSQLLFARGAIFVEGVTEAMLMQRFSEIMGSSLRDEAVEVVVLGSSGGFDHFRPLFANGNANYHRAVFITDGDQVAADGPSDDQWKVASSGQFDSPLDISGNVAVSVGYGTFEFGLLCAAIADGGRPGMQETLRSAMQKAAPTSVRDQGKDASFVDDFMDFDQPALAYKRMKQRKAGAELDWHSSWTTNSHFKAAKSDFAFWLYESLENLENSSTFDVPQYIKLAINFVLDATDGQQDGSHGTDD
jgi:predicted ATP-dependent endonuclease of OLD family